MLKKLAVSTLFTCALVGAISFAQTTQPAATAPATQAATKSMWKAYEGKFLIGTCADPGGYNEAEQANIKMHYNVITPENCMKPEGMQPQEGNFNWTRGDALTTWCAENNIKVWGHCLAWHAQTPGWFFQPGADGKPVTRELAMERLKKHVQTVVGHYKGKIIGWDVVNEAINDNGTGETENLRNSQWVRAIGPDYLTLAFKWAREADPDVHLVYNDYSIEQKGKFPSSLLLLKRLKAEGAPITGVGIQGHWHLDTDIPAVEKAVKAYGELGLKVSVTEMDVTATGTNSGAFNGGGGGGAMTEESFKQQAKVYAQLFDIFNRNAAVMERVTMWGMSDRRSWRSSQRPLLFDANLAPKPAYFAIIDVAEGKYVFPPKP
jgi:endo-1,4-beta-xylanase